MSNRKSCSLHVLRMTRLTHKNHRDVAKSFQPSHLALTQKISQCPPAPHLERVVPKSPHDRHNGKSWAFLFSNDEHFQLQKRKKRSAETKAGQKEQKRNIKNWNLVQFSLIILRHRPRKPAAEVYSRLAAGSPILNPSYQSRVYFFTRSLCRNFGKEKGIRTGQKGGH